MNRHIFILVPSPHPAGPVKGAYALANSLAGIRKVTLVYLKPGPGVNAYMSPDVEQIYLSSASGWRGWIHEYKKLLENAGGRQHVASISFCFSADVVNRFCQAQAVICSSIRGNLLRNYQMDYGWAGVPLAITHLMAVGKFDNIVAMNKSMAEQVSYFARKTPSIISNFVDEKRLEPYRYAKGVSSSGLRFVFLGSLSERKQPILVINAIASLMTRGEKVTLDMIGDGPLREVVAREVSRLSLNSIVRLHGHLANPYSVLAGASAMVLPSLSEGVSRAALEALHLGVPCVLRDIDGNNELIIPGVNGSLFRNEHELSDAMLAAAKLCSNEAQQLSLLPAVCRQHSAADQYLKLVESSR